MTPSAIYGNPDTVTGYLCRIGEIKESTGSQRGVNKVAPGTTKHFFAQHYAKRYANGNLPKRDGRRQSEGKEDGCDEKAFTDFVLAHDTEEDFPCNPDGKGNNVDRQVQLRPEPQIHQKTGVSNTLRVCRLCTNKIPASKHRWKYGAPN